MKIEDARKNGNTKDGEDFLKNLFFPHGK